MKLSRSLKLSSFPVKCGPTPTLSMQGLQTRGSSMRPPSRTELGEQFAHTLSPHIRQWCLERNFPPLPSSDPHAAHMLSPVQALSDLSALADPGVELPTESGSAVQARGRPVSGCEN